MFPLSNNNKAVQRYIRQRNSQGGLAAAAALTPEQRKEKARKAAQARWNKKKQLEESLQEGEEVLTK